MAGRTSTWQNVMRMNTLMPGATQKYRLKKRWKLMYRPNGMPPMEIFHLETDIMDSVLH